MRFEFAWGAGILAVIVYSLALAWVDMRDHAYLHDDRITACRPPGDQGEKLVATLSTRDDGVLAVSCDYHATQGVAP